MTNSLCFAKSLFFTFFSERTPVVCDNILTFSPLLSMSWLEMLSVTCYKRTHNETEVVTEDNTASLSREQTGPEQGEESGNYIYKSGHLGIASIIAFYVNVSCVQMQNWEHFNLSRTISLVPPIPSLGTQKNDEAWMVSS